VACKEIEALPTFFEHVTAIALLAFREAGVEVAILETGLGGRLDATTAAGASIVGITQIAMDHEEYLGNSLTSIASEKAAVIRPGVTAVIGEQAPEALEVLLKRCEAVGVQPSLAPHTDFYKNFRLNLRGAHQIQNASVAIRIAEALGISRDAIIRGLETTQHPGRLESIGSFLLDGAHNPAGAQALRNYLEEHGRHPLTLIFGAMRDKRLEQIAKILFPLADLLILTPIDNPRSATVETLAALAHKSAVETTSSAEALRIAIAQTPKDGLICITGSLYLIGETRPMILKLAEETV
jgi:dihydrofolate synthase/folylpolyglutamate synthase